MYIVVVSKGYTLLKMLLCYELNQYGKYAMVPNIKRNLETKQTNEFNTKEGGRLRETRITVIKLHCQTTSVLNVITVIPCQISLHFFSF